VQVTLRCAPGFARYMHIMRRNTLRCARLCSIYVVLYHGAKYVYAQKLISDIRINVSPAYAPSHIYASSHIPCRRTWPRIFSTDTTG
jgi:hypothetical protein